MIKVFQEAGFHGRLYKNIENLNRSEWPGYVWRESYKGRYVTVKTGYPADTLKKARLTKNVGRP
jgi:hypothetical protein